MRTVVHSWFRTVAMVRRIVGLEHTIHSARCGILVQTLCESIRSAKLGQPLFNIARIYPEGNGVPSRHRQPVSLNTRFNIGCVDG